MIAFFAATPYQVFNCVNILKNYYKNESADIYILTFACDISDLYCSLKKSSIFKNVYLFENIMKPKNKLGVIKDFIFTDSYILKTLKNKKYDKLFLTCIGDRNDLFYNKLLKNNKNLELYFYDEGIGIYINGFYQSSSNMLLFYKILNYKYSVENFKKVFVYNPELVMSDINCKLEKIPKVDKKSNFDLFNRVFNHKIQDNYDLYGYIYLDQYFSKYMDENEYKKTYKFDHNRILKIISNKIGAKNLIIKKHPVTPDDQYSFSFYNVSKDYKVPWEIIQLNFDMSNKVLITVNSTSVLTPKMIFNEEPYVILIGKALKNENPNLKFWNNNLDRMIFKFRCAYKKPEKIIVPESLKEFENKLEGINNN